MADQERAPEGPARARGLDRAIQIFEFLRRRRQSIGIGELAREIGAPRSSVYEIVARFVDAGILEVDDSNEVFFGRSVYFYADAYLASQPLVRLGRDEAIRLAQLTGETTQLCMLVGNKYTVAFMHPGASLFRISSEAGVLVPISLDGIRKASPRRHVRRGDPGAHSAGRVSACRAARPSNLKRS